MELPLVVGVEASDSSTPVLVTTGEVTVSTHAYACCRVGPTIPACTDALRREEGT
ncbi:hypothetical protein ACFYO2_43175 [Streptomyces sp. NPDC006602]|uniref:hypothetical protein n=1 Tax=Streptomyces sp. NPDC006602 TaxID=3364751 RepID=UPI00369E2A2A